MTTDKHPAKTWKFWVSRAMETLIALGLAAFIITIWEYRDAEQRASIPASEWWIVNDIYVPDHEVGSNPDMIYDREILVAHRGFWVAEVQRQDPNQWKGVFFAACTGSGVNDYDVDEGIPNDTVSWEWFFGRPCAVPPGTYRIQLTKDMTVPGYPVKQSKNYSNTFRVLPRGEKP